MFIWLSLDDQKTQITTKKNLQIIKENKLI